MKRACLLAALAVSCGGQDKDPGQGRATVVPAAPVAPLPTATAPSAPAVPPAPTETLREHMSGHFDAVRAIQQAVVTGDLATARQRAEWIVTHEEHPDLEAWKPHLESVKAAARELAKAADVPAAATITAKLGRRCGACHEGLSAVVAFAWEPEPDDQPGLPNQMRRHRWAAERLWEGVVGPSMELWTQGTSVLASSSLDVDAAALRGDAEAIRKAAAHLRELAGKAQGGGDNEARASLYGELLSTCATCHDAARDKVNRAGDSY